MKRSLHTCTQVVYTEASVTVRLQSRRAVYNLRFGTKTIICMLNAWKSPVNFLIHREYGKCMFIVVCM
jgi:hypothetical protein